MRDQQHGSSNPDEAAEQHQQGHAERPAAEQAQVDQRIRKPALAAHEEAREKDAGQDGEQGAGAGAVACHVLETIDDRQQCQQAQDGAVEIQPGHPRGPVFGDERRRSQQQERDNRQRHQEGGAPPVAFQEQASHQRAGGHAQREHGSPDADGQGPLLAPHEHIADESERGWHEGGACDAEQGAGGDQRRRGGRIGSHHGRCAEARRADHQEPAPSDTVTERSHRDEQAGDHEAIDIDDPEGLDAGRPQVDGQCRQGEVQQGQVQSEQDGRECQQAESDPLPGPGRPLSAGGARFGTLGWQDVVDRCSQGGLRCVRLLAMPPSSMQYDPVTI